MVEQASKSATKSSSSTAAATMKKLNKPPPEKHEPPPPESPSYRLALKNLFSCRNSHGLADSRSSKRQLGCSSAPSICKVNKDSQQKTPPPPWDEATANRRVSVSSERCVKKPLQSEVSSFTTNNKKLLLQGSSSSSSFRGGMQLRRLSSCYECHSMVVDPSSSSSSSTSRRAVAICPCPDCGEILVGQERLQVHQSTRHAVCELGSDDTSRNIIEIIFQSSWLKKQSPVCKIERILKVQNTERTLARFEEYRDAVKAKASMASSNNNNGKKKKKHPRCTADGNELLRFYCAALGCSLGLHGATHLCGACATCAIIRDGFVINAADSTNGIRTMATSGRAHDDDDGRSSSSSSRAMLVCRVIAGRVKKKRLLPSSDHEQDEARGAAAAADEEESEEEYESVGGSAGVYSNMEELQVFNPRAILPCFVVIYKAAAAAAQ